MKLDNRKPQVWKQTDENLRVHEVEEFPTVLWHGGFPGHSLRGRGTGRSKSFDTFPLLVNDKVFRERRRRRRRRAGPFQRIFAFISVLAILSFRGFGGRRNRNVWNGPSL
jgi:hypothetical protein